MQCFTATHFHPLGTPRQPFGLGVWSFSPQLVHRSLLALFPLLDSGPYLLIVSSTDFLVSILQRVHHQDLAK
jgi:hypothetical protein